jgi:hypothetical protein
MGGTLRQQQLLGILACLSLHRRGFGQQRHWPARVSQYDTLACLVASHCAHPGALPGALGSDGHDGCSVVVVTPVVLHAPTVTGRGDRIA